MIQLDEDALICDLAETYGIYDYRAFPPALISKLAYGLNDNSRIKRKLSHTPVDLETLLLAQLLDSVNLLVWFKTKDGQKGKNRPESISKALLPSDKSNTSEGFDSVEDFEKARAEFLGNLSKEGEK